VYLMVSLAVLAPMGDGRCMDHCSLLSSRVISDSPSSETGHGRRDGSYILPLRALDGIFLIPIPSTLFPGVSWISYRVYDGRKQQGCGVVAQPKHGYLRLYKKLILAAQLATELSGSSREAPERVESRH
jgi:hypothetical protein